MYVDVNDLLKQTQEIRKSAEAGTPVHTQSKETHHFADATVNPSSGSSPNVPTEQIKGNLERLQSLHHKLHAMLEELNKLTGKK
jgi:hypothetical protein